MGSVVGEGLITLLTAGVKYADNAGRLGKTGAFIQKLRKIKNLKRLRKVKNGVSKFRHTPKNLLEKLTLDEAKNGAGMRIIKNLNDPKFKGMEKWQHIHKHSGGNQSIIHYVRDPKTGKLMDFKFK